MSGPVQLHGRKVWIGCSGYVYKHWRGVVYPEGLPTSRWLDFYATIFPTVELNNTHYTLPSEQTFEAWRDNSPEGFVYAIKASRYLTHMKKLKDPEEPLSRLLLRAKLLGDRLGPVLYQLPPRWHYDSDRLEAFTSALPAGYEHVIEVRDPTWLNPDFFSKLEAASVGFCIASLPQYECPLIATAPVVYIRFHGSGAMYNYDYLQEELARWRDAIVRFTAEGHDVYCYFNNDPEGWAVKNALQLTNLVNEATTAS